MARTTWIVTIAGLGVLAACERAPTAPTASSQNVALARGGAAPSCTITLPPPANRKLPAVREVALEINQALGNAGTSLNCGQVRSLEAKFVQLVQDLDQPPGAQLLDAACGVSGAIVNELSALVKTGKLNPIIVPTDEGAGPNLLENAEFIHSQFCAAAHGGTPA